MTAQKQEAGAATTAPKNNRPSTGYCQPKQMSSPKRQEKIAARRAQIPKAYRATYDKAVSGKSLRAAINAQCLECCMWQRKEVMLCTDLACSLYAVRPYQRISQNGPQGQVMSAESKNSTQQIAN